MIGNASFRSIVALTAAGILSSAAPHAEPQDPCRAQAKTTDAAAQDYRAAVRNVATVCTKPSGDCAAAKIAAGDALAAIENAQQTLASACVGTTPPPPPAPAPSLPGDVVITEFMAAPTQGASGTEWFEVYNPTATEFDLKGLTIKDDGTNQFTVGTSLLLPPSGFVVFGSNADVNTNGGIPVDYVWSNFGLNNTGDQIEILNGTVSIDRVTYQQSTISHASSLDPMSFNAGANDNPASWCDAVTFMLNQMDYGTPKAMNPFCPIP